MTKKKAGRAVVFFLLLIVSFLFIMPFIWVLVSSVKPNDEIYSSTLTLLPRNPTLFHYQHVISQMGDFVKYSRNTVIVAFWGVLLTVVLSCLTAYSFSKFNYKGRGFFLMFVLLNLTVPHVIYLIPVYMMESKLDLIDTWMGLILPYVAMNMPMAIFIMRGNFNNIPNELMESAEIDGAGPLKTFLQVMLPIVKPGIATCVIITFVSVWGEFMFAKTLTQTASAQPLSVGIAFLRDEAASWQYGTLTAVITLSLVPLLTIFLLMQKYFVKGMMEGALKG